MRTSLRRVLPVALGCYATAGRTTLTGSKHWLR